MNESTLNARIRGVIERHANLPAVEGQHGSLSYRDLDAQSSHLASLLVASGVQQGHVVPLLMRRSPDLIVAQLAVLRLGAAYAPIDLASPLRRQLSMLAAIGAAVVVTDGTVSAAPDLVGGAKAVRWPIEDAENSTAQKDAVQWAATPVDAPAYVMFTSGSSGVPKGVLVPGDGIVRLVCGANFADFEPGARWAFLSSPAFDASTLEVWAPLLNGGCCVVQEQPLPSLDDLADFLVTRAIAHAWLTSALFNAVVEDRCDALGGLRQLLTGGERVSPRHAQLLLRAWPGIRLINGYGPTENTTFTLCHTIRWDDTVNPTGIPIGRPIHGTEVRIGEGETEPNEGELLTAGRGLSLGYVNDPELTASKFIFMGGQRWYRTGDLVRRRSDGAFEYLGRVDRQVKIQGHRIEIEEIETAIASYPGVSDAAVVVVGSTAESRHLVGFFACLSDPCPTSTELLEFLTERLAPQAVPRRLEIVDRFPVTLNGKVDRRALEARLNVQMPVLAATESMWNTDVERQLAGLWQAVLPGTTLDRHSHFVQLGGTSLLALKLSAMARRELNRDLSPIDILRRPILSEQALLLANAQELGADHSRTGGDDRHEFGLTLGQRALLNATRLDDSGSAYLVHVALRLPTQQMGPALQKAFQQLAERHVLLRCLVHHDDDRANAVVRSALPSGWWQTHDELDTAPSDLDWPTSLLQVLNREMDTSSYGVMRVDHWPVADGTALVVWTCHHAIIDESSIDRALAELHRLLNGESLPPVYGSPVAFPVIERAWLDHGELATLPQKIADSLNDEPAPADPVPGRGREVGIAIPSSLGEQLQAACARWGTTPFAPLLTAYGLALQDCFGPQRRFVMTPFSRRVEPELVEPLGYLLDVRMIAAGAMAGESEPATLARVLRDILALQRRSFLPTELLATAVERLNPAAAGHLSDFALTWRPGALRDVAMGDARARVIRVPQQAARFGICLHVTSGDSGLSCSIEALESHFERGHIDRLATAFLRRLARLCMIDAIEKRLEVNAVAHVDGAGDAVPAGVIEPLSRIWSRLIESPTATIGSGSHFLQSGGTSLLAMRLAAQVQHQFGQKIDLGRFLANPTFGRLCAMVHEGRAVDVDGCVWLGDRQASDVVVLIPGFGGHALGLYFLAEKLHLTLGQQAAVVIADIESMLETGPTDGPAAYLTGRTLQLLRDIGLTRIRALIGFSLGSLLALQLARQLAPTTVLTCLIDGYAPRVMRSGLAVRIESRLGRLLHGRSDAPRAEPPVASDLPHEPRSETSAQLDTLWELLKFELSELPVRAPNAHVHLIQAQMEVLDVGLLWRRSTNGFKPGDFASWQVHAIEAMHLDLPRKFASETAQLLADCIH